MLSFFILSYPYLPAHLFCLLKKPSNSISSAFYFTFKCLLIIPFFSFYTKHSCMATPSHCLIHYHLFYLFLSCELQTQPSTCVPENWDFKRKVLNMVEVIIESLSISENSCAELNMLWKRNTKSLCPIVNWGFRARILSTSLFLMVARYFFNSALSFGIK